MFRKLALGLVAAGSLGVAALAPSSASAFWAGPHGYGYGYGFGMHRNWAPAPVRFGFGGLGGGCIRQRLVETPWGFRYRPVNVCRY